MLLMKMNFHRSFSDDLCVEIRNAEEIKQGMAFRKISHKDIYVPQVNKERPCSYVQWLRK